MKSVKGDVFTKNIITRARVERQQKDCAERQHYPHQGCEPSRQEGTTGELPEPRKKKGDVGQHPSKEPSPKGCNQPRTTKKINNLSSCSLLLWVSGALAQLEARSQTAWDLTAIINMSVFQGTKQFGKV